MLKTSTQVETAAQISNLVEQKQNDEFLEAVELRLSKNEIVFSQECVSQIDTASPISLIKSKLVPSNFISKISDSDYVGLNGSVLEVLGQVEVKIIGKDFCAENVTLKVMPDHTMKCDTILGRDAIRLLFYVNQARR